MERKTYIDVLRIIATLMIMFNHTSTFGFALYTMETRGTLYWIYLFIAIMVKTAVPIFFMISGGLLLGKDEPVRKTLGRRVVRFFVVLLFGSVIHYFYFSKWQISVLSLGSFIKYFFSGGIVVQYWYLYSYLGFLLMLPILRKLAQGLQLKYFIYLIGMYFLMKCLQVVEFVIWGGMIEHSPYFSFFIMGDNVFYPLLGYFMEYRLPQNFLQKKYLVLAGVAAIVTIGVCGILTFWESSITNLWDEGSTQTFFNTFIFIPAACIYFCAKFWNFKYQLNKKVSKFISIVGTCTFGVYVFETIYREMTKQVFWKMLKYFPSLISSIVWILCAFTVGVSVTFVLKKLPVIKKLL